MLRLTSTNHIRLSEMADAKANILMSVNAIIVSVILTVMLPRLQEQDYLVIPSIIFLVTAISTIIVAVIAVRPGVNKGTFTSEDVQNKKINLLFFGNFHKMVFPDYELAMRKMMRDPDYLYRSLLKDIYFLGVVLAKKFRLIRFAYNIFMIGLIVSIISFSVAVLFS